ncbi:NAD(P)/FAD-dependent oxidoreductase [Chloroflexota bacterium]
MQRVYDVVIIGGGPAGLTAGLYTSRARLDTLLLEKETPGGQVMNIDLVENWPGSAEISGAELGSNMMTQAMNSGVQLELAEVQGIKLETEHKIIRTTQGNYLARAIIIAGGARHKKLGVPGEEEFAGQGVFYCAICDGGHFANKVVAVVGGGDGGLTEGLYLTRIVSKVIVIEIMPELMTSKILQERALANTKIEMRCGTRVEAILGDSEVREISIIDVKTGNKDKLRVDGVLVHVGLNPNTDYLNGIISLDNSEHIQANERMETEIPGIFAAGDIRHNSLKQIVTATGDGATAALSAEKYLRKL